jgi:hypothetical protein
MTPVVVALLALVTIAAGKPVGDHASSALDPHRHPHEHRSGAKHAARAVRSSQQTSVTGEPCHPIPPGKKVAIAQVWIELGSNSTADVDEASATKTVCELMLSMVKAHQALTSASMCLNPDQVEMLVVTDLATLPTNVKNMYEAAGAVLKNGMTDSAMVEYKNIIEAEGDDPEDGEVKAIHMVKLAAMWDTDYAAVLTIDTDLMVGITGGEQKIDLINMLLDPNGPQAIYRHGPLSPINAGFFAFKPDVRFHDRFVNGVKAGFDRTTGWGAPTYNKALIDKYTEWSKAYMKDTAKNFCSDLKTITPWCWIGSDQDQGMLGHMFAAAGPDGVPFVTSHDLRGDILKGPDEHSELTGDSETYHYTGHTKPWSKSGVGEESKNGKVPSDIHTDVAHFWSHYGTLYRQAWTTGPQNLNSVCPAFYQCLYKEIASLDTKLMEDVQDDPQATEFMTRANAASCTQ